MRNKDEEIKQFLKIPPEGRIGYVKRQYSSLPERILLILKNRTRERKKITPPQLLMVGVNTQLGDNCFSGNKLGAVSIFICGCICLENGKNLIA